ncbi:MAG: hypothetical protein JW806_02745 [Sedimentisphaerales bacterium]|nr:hypothetical protein [Sedimentisphaerales bacterium]
MKKIIIIISALFVAFYLFASRPHWFSELEQQIDIGKDFITSETVDVSRPNTFRWVIPKEEWNYKEGRACLNIIFDRKDDIPVDNYDKEVTPLRVRVAAYGILDNNEEANRLIKNWYYLSNEPFSPGLRIGVSWGTKVVEYMLAGIDVYIHEKMVIELEVLTPDEKLAKANPRLQLVGEHDYAVFGHIGVFRIMRDGGLFISIIALLYLVVNAIKDSYKNATDGRWTTQAAQPGNE